MTFTISPGLPAALTKGKEDGVFPGQMGPVQMRILMQPAHWDQVERHEKNLRESLERFESWYGPIPTK